MKQLGKISEDTSGRITVAFSYDPVYIEKVKAIKGYKWHPKEKHWSFPYSDGVIDRILSIFKGEKTELDPTLQVTKKSLKTELNFEDLRRELSFRKYSPKTIKAYIHYNRDFLQKSKKPPQQVTNGDIGRYIRIGSHIPRNWEYIGTGSDTNKLSEIRNRRWKYD